MEVNESRVRRLAGELRQAIQRLTELAELDESCFLDDPHKVASAKYHLIVATEAIIDISNHIISKNKLGTPEDYGDIFRLLGKAGIVPADFAGELMKMARFRNRLVHIYWDVDDAEIYRLLSDGVADMERFLKLLRETLSSYLDSG
ncbi:MAG: DUF86 domain-containing protein [Candidatus Bipolaricaulota bacterium]